DREIVRRREESRVPGNAAQVIGARIVDFAEHPAAFALLRRGTAFLEIGAGTKAGVFHAERLEDALLGEIVERRATDVRDDLAEQDVVDVAIGELAAGRRDRIEGEEVLPR